ncbi:MAG TPA: GNAT family N-acetyltransferase [Solirubrobacteraceae bacterium]|jgi:predicted GNAT family N-acyltransferase|nr:GNAT family N-acetyltransferase [Solirubrobacteraceae bacterium]
MRVEPLSRITEQDWEQLVDGEQEPWGSLGEGLEWGEKDRNLGLRDDDGRLIGVAGAVVARVDVAGTGSFEVVGLGSLFVTSSRRGAALTESLIAPLLELAAAMGPERAMLFCREQLVPVYSRLGFEPIEDPVWIEQPAGRVRMPLAAMWLALHLPTDWPPGRVDVAGLPF